jgi:hypothetical protein
MDDKVTKRGGGAAVAIVLVVVLVLLPMIYVQSIGPAAWLHGSGWLSGEGRSILEAAYFPVKWTAQNVTVIGPVIEKYANWCEGDRAVSLLPLPTP